MAWHGPYYYRTRRKGRRVVREYVGTGEAARLASQLDALLREQRRQRLQVLRNEKAELAALDAEMREMMKATDLVARAALRAAGFHQHKRGEWRRRRGTDDQ
jgi:hypothetical protein